MINNTYTDVPSVTLCIPANTYFEGRKFEAIFNTTNILNSTYFARYLIEIQAKLHLLGDSNEIIINNSYNYINIVERIHSKELGICFTYSESQYNFQSKNLIMRDNDFIELLLNQSNYSRLFN